MNREQAQAQIIAEMNRDSAGKIVRDIAAQGPPVIVGPSTGTEYCAYCDAEVNDATGHYQPASTHAQGCPWRRSIEHEAGRA